MADLAGAHREFFAVRTVAETLAGFRPARRTAAETVALGEAHGRVPCEPARAPHDLPGFARSTVDGYAVRAADTYGASEGLPSYLDVAGAVAMGRATEGAGAPGAPFSMPTGCGNFLGDSTGALGVSSLVAMGGKMTVGLPG